MAIDWKKRRASQKAWTKANRQHVRQYWHQWRLDNIEKVRKASRESKRRARVVEKQLCIAAYGGKCACCGVTERNFLTLGHINNNGAEERRQFAPNNIMLFSRLKRLGYPPGYRVECYNCNCGSFRNGGTCPHVTH